MPIHCWAIEHQGVLRLVDTGETAAARNVPFARMEVTRAHELPAALAAAALNLDGVDPSRVGSMVPSLDLAGAEGRR